jgi:translation initiation factor 5B
MESLRQLIVSVVGHVDHGKSSLLDKIRGSCIVDSEPGKITQAIGASLVPADTIKEFCGQFIQDKALRMPGLLFIDTPGHAAFTSQRKRGGSLADMAVLIVDINEGFKPQTIEALEILKQFKTPFIVAANKIDLIQGWNREAEGPVLKGQRKEVIDLLDKKLYELVGRLYEFSMQTDRFDRIADYAKQVGIVPISAITGQGVAELMLMLIGLAQKFMVQKLTRVEASLARGTVLEVKEATGLGTVLDTVLYAGCLKKNDVLLVGGINGVTRTKVKALLVPDALCEIRDKKAKFRAVQEVESAAAVRISAPELSEVVAGMPLIGLPQGAGVAEAEEDILSQIEDVVSDVEGEGIVVRADSLGSVEALLKMLHEKGIGVKSASIGDISKKDISEAESSMDKEPLDGVILGFNVQLTRDAEEQLLKSRAKVLTADVIYRLIDDYEKWVEQEKQRLQERELEQLVQPAKFMVIPGYVFRQSNPAIFGIEVLAGKLRLEAPVMNAEGKVLSTVKSLQENQDSVQEAEKEKKVALSIMGVIVGRQVHEGDTLYTAVPERDFKKFKELKHLLSKEQKELLREVADIMRKTTQFWGI